MFLGVILAIVLGAAGLLVSLLCIRERETVRARLDLLEGEILRLENQLGRLGSRGAAAGSAAVPAKSTVADFILPTTSRENSAASNPLKPTRDVAARQGWTPAEMWPTSQAPASQVGAGGPGSVAVPEEATTPARTPSVPFETRLGQWLGWLAAVTIVLTVALFIKWTNDIGLLSRIPTEVYIGLGWLGGLTLLGLGERFRSGLPLYGQGLTGAGIASLYVSTYAGYRYDVVGDAPASVGLILVGAIAIWLAMRHNSPSIGWIGIVLAYASPVMVGGKNSGPAALFLYITALNFAVLAISVVRRWTAFRSAAFVCTAILYLSWYVGKFSAIDADLAITFLLVNWAIFVGVLAIYPLLRRERTQDGDLALAALNPLFAGALLYPLLERAHPQWTGAAATFLAISYWFLSRAIRASRLSVLTAEEREAEDVAPAPPDYLEQVFFAAGVVFAILAIPLQLHGRSITAMWALMGAGLYYSGFRTGSRRTCIWSAVPLLLALARLPLFDAELPSSAPMMFNARGFSFGVVLLSLLTVAATTAREWFDSNRSNSHRLTQLTLLSLVIGALFQWWIFLDTPRAWYPAGWAVVAALGLAYGWQLRCSEVRGVGLLLALPPLGCALLLPGRAIAPFDPAASFPGWFAMLALCMALAVLYERCGDGEVSERWLSPVLGGAACLLLFVRTWMDASSVWLPVAWAATAAFALLAGVTTRSKGHQLVGIAAAVIAVGNLLFRLANDSAPNGDWWLRAPGFASAMLLCLGVAWVYLTRDLLEVADREAVGVVALGAGALVGMTWGGVELSPGWLPLSWLVVTGGLLGVGVRRNLASVRGVALLAAAALSCEVLLRELSLPGIHLILLHTRSVAALAAVTAWVALAWVIQRTGDEVERKVVPYLVLAANLQALGWISLEALDLGTQLAGVQWSRQAGQFALSAAWITYAAAAIGIGFWRDRIYVRWGGAALLLLTVAKVYLFDLSFLSLGYRVLSFLVLAVVLLGVSYLYQRSGAREGQ